MNKMSILYKENNNETSLELFNKNIVYTSDVIKSRSPNLIDFNFCEKAFYGKTNRDFMPIVLNPKFSILKNFKSVDDPRQNLQAIGFVVDAFEALAQQFKKAEQSGKIYSDDPYLTNLKVYKSYENYNINYLNYQNQFLPALKQQFNLEGIVNFKQFAERLLNNVSIITRTMPMSMPAYIKSRFNNLSSTGFSIEIADSAYENDDQKISQFVNSKNWEFYVNACNSYGFMIDINAPWRLIADIDSESMIGYASQSRQTTTDEILNLNFKTIHNEFFSNLPSLLLNLYNEIVPSYVPTFDECGSTLIQTERYTLQGLKDKFSNDFFLRFYFNLRLSEEESQFSDAEKQRIINDCLQISRSQDNRAAVRRFERFVNQPFDYRGSLSYVVKAQRLREDT